MQAWCGVEVRHLAALKAIERERSFRGAADSLGYVQSAISQQISRLESLVGARLVQRTRGRSRVELTAAGKTMLTHGDRVLAQLEAARTDLEAAAVGSDGKLHVGAPEAVTARILPRVLSLLATTQPELRPVLECGSNQTSWLDAVRKGELDAAFGELPLDDEAFAMRRLLTEPCVLLVNRESPLALRDEPPTLAEIAALPLIKQPGWRMSGLLDGQFATAGLSPDYRYRVDSSTAIHGLVGCGTAAAIVPRLAVDEHDPNTTALAVEFLPKRTLAIYWHRDRTSLPALGAFVDAVETICTRLSAHAPSRRLVESSRPLSTASPLAA
jgi:DNA-binding transcriptional LysR family regulator